MTLAPGTRLGRYEIRSLLGSGGMGEVYLARDTDLERDIAIKILRDDKQSGDRAQRFIQEARAASALHHPNVAHVYEIGSHDDYRFIAMEVVEGETLRDRIGRGPLAIAEATDLITQITSALAAAHKQNVIHRDVKPENVIVSADGYAKVLDFGLAKLSEVRGDDAATLLKTAPGTAMGTLPYMAPEVISGDEATAAADVYSLGVLMFEVFAGRRPFTGANSSELVGSVLSKPAPRLRELRSDAPPAIESVIAKCLVKDPAARYTTATELLRDLRQVAAPAPVAPRKRNRVLVPLAIAVVIAIVATFAVSSRRRDAVRRAAEIHLDTAEQLVEQHRQGDAYEHVAAAAAVLPDSDRVRDLLTRTSAKYVIESEPPGATVYARRFKGPADRIRLGVTPLTVARMPRADFVLTFEKPGYATANASVTLATLYLNGDPMREALDPVRVKLIESSKIPDDMVLVPGGMYRLAGAGRPTERPVQLKDFFIDRYEVSNREYERFVRDGGYRRPELWKHPFTDKGKTISFDEAITRFRDSTGLPGPRSWSGGVPPAGRENHPVVDITWYEAAAFANWKNKTLPTIYQWEKASRQQTSTTALNAYPWGLLAEGVDFTERSNFLGAGAMTVDSMPFGISPFGAYHMAGNVSEWCRNELPPGFAARGGSFQDAAYQFGQTAGFPGFFSSPTLGFRCAIGGGGEEGEFALSPNVFVPQYKPVDDKTFAQLRQRYEYASDPLNAEVVERVETPDWTREKILYTVAGKRVPAYLYLPKGFARPLQVIHFAPAGDVTAGYRTLPRSIEVQWAALIRTGRAMFSVELEGFLGRPRPSAWKPADPSQDEYVDDIAGRVTEMRRGLDYLETRPEIDHSRIALLGVSAGGGTGVFCAALDNRYRSILFSGTGITLAKRRYAPAADRINFVSRITAPTMMLHGRYDEDASLKSEAAPMFALLRAPKQFEVFEGSHIAPLSVSVPTFTKWLDQTMGPVKR